jgi:hypothetical protein
LEMMGGRSVRPRLPGASGWRGRRQAEENGGSQALFTPLAIHTVPNSPPPTAARPAGWAGGGEVGGERCGALRQWGRLAKPLGSRLKVAKCLQP